MRNEIGERVFVRGAGAGGGLGGCVPFCFLFFNDQECQVYYDAILLRDARSQLAKISREISLARCTMQRHFGCIFIFNVTADHATRFWWAFYMRTMGT